MERKIIAIILTVILCLSSGTAAIAEGMPIINVADEQVQEGVLQEEAKPDEENQVEADPEAISPRAPAPDLRWLKILNISSKGDVENREEITTDGLKNSLNVSPSAFYNKQDSKENHYKGEVVVTIRQIGYSTSTVVNIDGKTPSATSNIYNMVVEDGMAVEWSRDYTFTAIDPDVSKSRFYYRTYATNDMSIEFEREVFITWQMPDRTVAPVTPQFTYGVDYATGVALTGTDSTMEYRLSTDTDWKTCQNTDMNVDLPTANKTYYVRYAATADLPESHVKTLTLYAPADIPPVTISFNTEQFGGLITSMEIRAGNGEFTDVTAATIAAGVAPFIDNVPAGTTMDLGIRIKATESRPASKINIIKIYPRAAVPTTVMYNKANIQLTGTTTAMQYRIGSDINWKKCYGPTVTLESYVTKESGFTVEVRVGAGGNNAASKSITFTAPALLAGPYCTLDIVGEKIDNLIPGVAYEYMRDMVYWYTLTVANGSGDISKSISTTENRTLFIRKAKTATEPPTAGTEFSMPMRPTVSADIKFVYNDPSNVDKGVLAGMTNEYEYKVTSSKDWISSTGNTIAFDVPASGTTYHVRKKSKGLDFASLAKVIPLNGYLTSPYCAYDANKEVLSKLPINGEWNLNGSGYVKIPVGTTTFSTTSTIDGATGPYTIMIKIPCTAINPRSNIDTITLYPRLAVPTTPIFNPSTKMITGVANAMQYRNTPTGVWNRFPGTSCNATPIIGSSTNMTLEIRYAAINKNSASKSMQLKLY